MKKVIIFGILGILMISGSLWVRYANNEKETFQTEKINTAILPTLISLDLASGFSKEDVSFV